VADYDAIVLGTGGVGSAALHHLARRGFKVVGLDRFGPAHGLGSSHTGTRMIRLAYFEHPEYVPLLRRAFVQWEELQDRRHEQLYRQVGLVEVGPPEGELVTGILRAAALHELDVESLDAATARRRFGGYALGAGQVAVFERRAGILAVEACVLAHLHEASEAGAELRTGVAVLDWRTDGEGVEVTTDSGTVRADRLVVAAGPWAGQVLADIGLDLRVLRKPVFWFGADPAVYGVEAGCPMFIFETGRGTFYGFPALDGTVKVGEHTGGELVGDPLAVDRAERPSDRAAVAAFLADHLPGVDLRPVRHEVCMYTCTPDGHFVVDVHPDAPQVCFAAGLSGHGFKLAPVLGEALADLAVDGSSDLPIAFLGMHAAGRGALTRPRRDGAAGPSL
jgi:sarcosine oxidase